MTKQVERKNNIVARRNEQISEKISETDNMVLAFLDGFIGSILKSMNDTPGYILAPQINQGLARVDLNLADFTKVINERIELRRGILTEADVVRIREEVEKTAKEAEALRKKIDAYEFAQANGIAIDKNQFNLDKELLNRLTTNLEKLTKVVVEYDG